MKIEQLRYFLEAARHEHVAKAAGIVAISPSAISQSIKSLEGELGRKLFIRHGKSIFLTAHGRLLMEKAEGFIRDLEAIKDEMAAEGTELRGHFRLAGTHYLCSRHLAPAWSTVQQGHAALTVEMFSLRSSQVAAGTAAGEFDLGLCLNPLPHPRISSRTVHEGRLVLTVRAGHPALKAPPSLILKELNRYPAVLPKAYQGIDNCETHPVFEKHGIVPRAEFIFDNYEVAAARIASSSSWGLFPDWLARGLPGLKTIVPRKWDAPVRAAVIWPSHRPLTRVLRACADAIGRGF